MVTQKGTTQPPKCRLLLKTIELVKTCGKSPAQLARETGLSYYWVQSLRYNEDIDPSVNKIVMMYEHLTGKQLEV